MSSTPDYQSLIAYCKASHLSFSPTQIAAWSRRLAGYCDYHGIFWAKGKDRLHGRDGFFPTWVIEKTIDILGPDRVWPA